MDFYKSAKVEKGILVRHKKTTLHLFSCETNFEFCVAGIQFVRG